RPGRRYLSPGKAAARLSGARCTLGCTGTVAGDACRSRDGTTTSAAANRRRLGCRLGDLPADGGRLGGPWRRRPPGTPGNRHGRFGRGIARSSSDGSARRAGDGSPPVRRAGDVSPPVRRAGDVSPPVRRAGDVSPPVRGAGDVSPPVRRAGDV